MSACLLLSPVNVCISASSYTSNIQSSQFSGYFSCVLNSSQRHSPAVQETAAERSVLAGLGKCILIRNQSASIYSSKWVPGNLSEHCKPFVNACISKDGFLIIFSSASIALIVILACENYPQRTVINTFNFIQLFFHSYFLNRKTAIGQELAPCSS